MIVVDGPVSDGRPETCTLVSTMTRTRRSFFIDQDTDIDLIEGLALPIGLAQLFNRPAQAPAGGFALLGFHD